MASLAKRVFHHAGLLRLARLARTEQRGVILRYHAITATTAPVLYAVPSICMPVAAFRLQMTFVKRAYTVLPLEALVGAIVRGGLLPRRAVALTFDDGYADNHALGLPVLQRLGLPATVYVATGSVNDSAPFWGAAVRAVVFGSKAASLAMPDGGGVTLGDPASREIVARELTRALVPVAAADRADWLAGAASRHGVDLGRELAGTMLRWDQIRDLANAGWTIGAHTVTHSNVAMLDPRDAEAEIAVSRDALAAAVGTPVCHFCYPNSGGQHAYFSPGVSAILRRLGFQSATTSRPGSLRPGVDPFSLPRLGVTPRLAPVAELATAMERQRLAA